MQGRRDWVLGAAGEKTDTKSGDLYNGTLEGCSGEEGVLFLVLYD